MRVACGFARSSAGICKATMYIFRVVGSGGNRNTPGLWSFLQERTINNESYLYKAQKLFLHNHSTLHIKLLTFGWLARFHRGSHLHMVGNKLPSTANRQFALLNAAQVWNAASATNRGNLKPHSFHSFARQISSRFS